MAEGARCGLRSARGQASVELVAGIPALVLCGLIALQLLTVGYASSPAGPAVRGALPGWARGRVDVSSSGGSLTVRLRPPSPFAALADALEVSSSAWTRAPAREGSGSGG